MFKRAVFICFFITGLTSLYAQLLSPTNSFAIKVGNREFTKGLIDSATRYQAMTVGRGQQLTPDQMKQVKYSLVNELVAGELLKLEAVKLKIKVPKTRIDSSLPMIVQNDQKWVQMAQDAAKKGEKDYMKVFRSYKKAGHFKSFLKKAKLTEKEMIEKAKEQLMVQVLTEKVAPMGEVKEEDLKKFFNNNRKEMPVDDSISGYQLTYKLNKKDSKDNVGAKKEALKGIAAQIKLRKKSIQGLAQQAANDPDMELKPIASSLAKLPVSLNKSLSKVKVGQVSEVFRSKEGLNVFLLTGRNDGEFDSYRDRIGRIVVMQKQQEVMMKLSKYVAELAQKYTVTFYDENYRPPMGLSAPGNGAK